MLDFGEKMGVRENVTQALWYAGGGDGLSLYTRSLPLMYVAVML